MKVFCQFNFSILKYLKTPFWNPEFNFVRSTELLKLKIKIENVSIDVERTRIFFADVQDEMFQVFYI